MTLLITIFIDDDISSGFVTVEMIWADFEKRKREWEVQNAFGSFL